MIVPSFFPQDVYDMFDPSQSGSVVRAEMLVGFMEDKSILLSRFPKHTSEIPQVGVLRFGCVAGEHASAPRHIESYPLAIPNSLT